MDPHLVKAIRLGLVALVLMIVTGVYLAFSFFGPNDNLLLSGDVKDNLSFCGTVDPYSQGDDVKTTIAGKYMQKQFDYEAGGKLFIVKCAACHAINKKIIGPPMADLIDRIPDIEWLTTYITNEPSLAEIKDEYYLKIKDYDSSTGNHTQRISEDDLNDLVGFVLSQ